MQWYVMSHWRLLEGLLYLCKSLDVLHSHLFVHGDLSPLNVIIGCEGGKVRTTVISFGKARVSIDPTPDVLQLGKLVSSLCLCHHKKYKKLKDELKAGRY